MSGRYSLSGIPLMSSIGPSAPVDYSLMSGWGAQPGAIDGGGMQGNPAAQLGGAVPTVPQGGGGWFDGFLSKVDANGMKTQGWGDPALSVASGLINAFMGMQQYGLYKDQLAESKKQFGLNYAAQRQTTNAALEDRQLARVASNPGAYQSVGDYMAKNSIRAA